MACLSQWPVLCSDAAGSVRQTLRSSDCGSLDTTSFLQKNPHLRKSCKQYSLLLELFLSIVIALGLEMQLPRTYLVLLLTVTRPTKPAPSIHAAAGMGVAIVPLLFPTNPIFSMSAAEKYRPRLSLFLISNKEECTPVPVMLKTTLSPPVNPLLPVPVNVKHYIKLGSVIIIKLQNY